MKTTSSFGKPLNMEDLEKQISYRQDPEFTKKHIVQKPQAPWKTQYEPGRQALTYQLYAKVESSSIIPAIERSMKGFDFMNFQEVNDAALSIAHTLEATRTEARRKNVFGEGFCYIQDEKQGLLYLDKKDKTFLHLEAERMPKLAYNDNFRFQVTEVSPGRDQLTRVTLLFSAPLKIRYVLTLDGDKKYEPYSKKMWCAVVGCPGRFSKAGIDWSQFWQYGVPVGVEIFSAESADASERLSFVEVKDLKLVEDRELFAIPAGYRDLRSVEAPAKDYTAGKPVRFSTVRKSTFRRPKRFDTNAFPGAGSLAAGEISEGNFRFPSCFPSTYGSLIANVVDQRLLDDVRFLFNGVTRRLSGFSGSNGDLDIDWLNQFQVHANALAGGDGSGLFHLLRDDSGGGKGLLDILSRTEVQKMLVEGNVSALALPATLLAQVNAVISNPAINPEDRFDNLGSAAQQDLRDAFLMQKIGSIHLDYPSTTPAQSIFHDLLNIKIYDLDFNVQINNQSLMSMLRFESGSTHLHLALPDASGSAWLLRWPSGLYWTVLATSGIGCLIFPPACALFGFALAVGTFLLLDFAYVSIDLSNVEIDAQITFAPNATTDILQPEVDLELDADVSVFYGSVIPTGVHQIVSLIITAVANLTSIVIDQIESQAESKLNDFLKTSLSLSYPPQFGPVPISSIFNFQEYNPEDRFYIESRLNAGVLGVVSPYLTQVDSEVRSKLLTLRDEFKMRFRDPVDVFNSAPVSGNLIDWADLNFTDIARYYLGTVISQNFLNHYIHTLWRQFQFNYDFSAAEATKLIKLLKEHAPDLEFCSDKYQVHLWPAVSPRTVLTPLPASQGAYYATTFFDDVRLCFEFECGQSIKANRIEFQFAAQAFTEIGFGGVDQIKSRLDILKTTDRVFDLYFDLQNLTVEIIHPETHSLTIPEMPVSVNFDYSVLPLLQKVFQTAIQFALASRDSSLIPRGDSDSKMIQRYELGTPALVLVMELTPFRGNIYINKGLTGIGTAIYEHALNIDTLNKIMAILIREAISRF